MHPVTRATHTSAPTQRTPTATATGKCASGHDKPATEVRVARQSTTSLAARKHDRVHISEATWRAHVIATAPGGARGCGVENATNHKRPRTRRKRGGARAASGEDGEHVEVRCDHQSHIGGANKRE